MRIGIGSILLGNGVAGLLAWFGQTIPALVLSVIFTMGGIILLVIAFRTKGKSNKSLVTSDNILKIGAKVGHISTSGYYDRTEGGYPEGYKQVPIDVILAPVRSMTLDIIALELWGKRFEAKTQRDVAPFDLIKLTPLTLTDPHTYLLVFDVPKELAIDTKEAYIYVLSGNLLEWYSEQFAINFGGTK